ncbi:MAG: hypothetical protein ACE5R4_03025 [Armatimonadota bacterium]
MALLSRVFLMLAVVTTILAGITRFLVGIFGITPQAFLDATFAFALLSIACGVVHIFELMGRTAPAEPSE